MLWQQHWLENSGGASQTLKSVFAIACPVPYHPSCHHLRRGKRQSAQNKERKLSPTRSTTAEHRKEFAVCMIHVGSVQRYIYGIFKCACINAGGSRTFCLHVLAFRGLSDIDGEHDDLGRHGRHLVAEAELVGSVHVRRHGVFPTGLSVAFVNLLTIRPGYLEIHK